MATAASSHDIDLSVAANPSDGALPSSDYIEEESQSTQILIAPSSFQDDQDSDDWEDVGSSTVIAIGNSRVTDGETDPAPNEAEEVEGKGATQKKSKKQKDRKTQQAAEVRYEGYTLEKADPDPGKRSTWSRVGKRRMRAGEKNCEAL